MLAAAPTGEREPLGRSLPHTWSAPPKPDPRPHPPAQPDLDRRRHTVRRAWALEVERDQQLRAHVVALAGEEADAAAGGEAPARLTERIEEEARQHVHTAGRARIVGVDRGTRAREHADADVPSRRDLHADRALHRRG